jgi:uncharacterized protein (TIGR03067 family)
LARLPDKYRALIVLCKLEGNTLQEVARQLAIPAGTVASRLATARAMLARRLSRRGVVGSGVLLGALVSPPAAAAGVPMAVVASTIQTAVRVALGQGAGGPVSPPVAALLTGVTKAMFRSKIRSVLAVALVVGLGLGGGGLGVGLFREPAAVAQKPGGGGPGGPGVPGSQEELIRLAPAHRGKQRDSTTADVKQELARLQGRWLVVGAEEAGQTIPEKDVKAAKETFVVKGGTMTYCRGGKVQVTMEIILAPGKRPRAMDLEFTDGKEQGAKNHAIYQLDGDVLKLRMNDKFGGNSASERPQEFSTAQGKEAALFILKRGKN